MGRSTNSYIEIKTIDARQHSLGSWEDDQQNGTV
jgi:hypothetical protein